VKPRRIATLWPRIADGPTALPARRNPGVGALRLVVEGAGWELPAGAGGHARCTAAEPGAPALRLSRQALGSLYLGGASASQRARAGAVLGEPAAIAVADRLFASPAAPWCPEVF
jgi:hypothetical protein